MSRVTSIPEVFEMSDDVTIEVLKGTIKKAFKRNPPTGYKQGNYGDWSFEDLLVTDGANEIKVTLKDREPLDQKLIGKQVYFLSSKTEAHGWKGVKTKDDKDAEDKPRRVIWVTKAGEIVLASAHDDGGAPANEPPRQPGRAAAPPAPASDSRPPASAPAANKPPGQPSAMTPKGALAESRVFAARRVSLLKVATNAALVYADEFNKSPKAIALGLKMTPEAFWPKVTSLYLSMEAEGLAIRRGFADAMPVNIAQADLTIIEKAKTPGGSATSSAPPPPPKPRCPACGSELDAEGVICKVCPPPDDDNIPF